jgi:hypothetical protein
MPNRITKDFLQQYEVVKGVIVDIELFSHVSSKEDPHIMQLNERLQTELNVMDDMYQDYSMITADYGGIDKEYLRNNITFMTFLITYLPHIYKDMEQSVYGGKHKRSHSKSLRKSTRKVKSYKKSSRKNKKPTRKGK